MMMYDMMITIDQSYNRINLGPIMDGRNVAVADFTGNGLLDIFIVCVTDKHLLLIQTTSGSFEEIFITNHTALSKRYCYREIVRTSGFIRSKIIYMIVVITH